jgi:LAGLIDADG endonuclease
MKAASESVLLGYETSSSVEQLGFWLAGLVDGEGCFYFATRRRRLDRYPGRLYRSIVFTFKVNLRADDRDVLLLARSILDGVGTIKAEKHKRFSYRGKPRPGNPQFCWAVNNKQEIASVIAFFRRYPLLSKKARDFKLWSEAFELFQSAIAETALTCVRKNVIPRVSQVARRPLIGTKRQRFRSIPDSLFAQMLSIEKQLKGGRQFIQ